MSANMMGGNSRNARPRSAPRTRNEESSKPSVGGARGIRALRKNRDPEDENNAPTRTTKKSARVDAARAYLAENVDPLMAEIINFLLSNQPKEADRAILSFLEARRNNEEYKVQSPSRRSTDRNAVLRDRQYMARTVQPILEKLMKRVVEDQPVDVEAHFIKQLKLDPSKGSLEHPEEKENHVPTSLTNRLACDALFRMLDENFAGKLTPREIIDNIHKFSNIGVPIDSLASKFWLNVSVDVGGNDQLDKAAFHAIMKAVANSNTPSFKLSSFYTSPPVASPASAPVVSSKQVAAKLSSKPQNNHPSLKTGTTVVVNYKKTGNFYPGKISTVRDDGSYDIAYDDGDSEMKVPLERIEIKEASKAKTTSPTNSTNHRDAVVLNSRVEVNYKKSGNYFTGVVAVVHEDGTFNIAYDDGDSEAHVPLERIKLLDPLSGQVIPLPNSASDTAVSKADTRTANKKVEEEKKDSIKPVIALVGISGAGKSTLLKAMSGDPDPKPRPTTGFSQKKLPFEIEGNEVTVHWYDLPGSWTGKWEGYLTECHGVVFVADASANEDTISETSKAFQDTMNGAAAHGKPLLVLANKQDVEGARGAQDMNKLLGCGEQPTVHVVASSGHPERNGGEFDPRIEEGLEWLLGKVAAQYSDLSNRVKRDEEAAAEAAAQEKLERHRRVFTKLLKEKAFPEEGEPMETFSVEDSYEFLAMELLIHDPQVPERTRKAEEAFGLSEVAQHVVHLVGCQKMAMIMVADMINPEHKKTKTTHSWEEVVAYVKDRREDAGLSRDL